MVRKSWRFNDFDFANTACAKWAAVLSARTWLRFRAGKWKLTVLY